MNNISNLKLYWILTHDGTAHQVFDIIKSEKFKNANINKKQLILKNVYNIFCESIENALKIENKSLPRPEVDDDVEHGYFGKYTTEDNIIHLDFDDLSVGKIMHEFRHYIQYHFEEKSYLKGVKVPLPDPFYPLQKHELNAYDFQFLFDGINISELFIDARNIIDNAKDLFALGYLNKQTFDIERNYYKAYNKMCDLQKVNDEEVAFDRDRFKIKDYDVCVDADIFFSLKNEESEIDFSIINNKCTVYAINYETKCTLLEHFTARNNQQLSQEELKYQNICKDAIKIVSAFCKAKGVKKIDINPCTPAVHKNKFEIILKKNQKDYRGTECERFNQFYDIKAEDELVTDIKTQMKIIDIDNRTPDDYIDEDLILNKKEDEEYSHPLYKALNKPEINER